MRFITPVIAATIVTAIGFSLLSCKTETFSQGWNMRIELAKILLGSPDLLCTIMMFGSIIMAGIEMRSRCEFNYALLFQE